MQTSIILRCFRQSFWLVLFCLLTRPGSTQSKATLDSLRADSLRKAAAAAAAKSDSAKKPVAKVIPKVIEVYRLGAAKGEENRAGIGDIIVVRVQNLKELLDKANCIDSLGKPIADCRKQAIRLFIDGRMIKEIEPESGAPQEDKGELQYHLQRNPQNDEAWADILGSPVIGRGFTKRAVRISVGLENEYPIPTDVNKFILNRVRLYWFLGSSLFLLLYFALLYLLATRSELLRDRGIDVSALGIERNPALKPYSLGRIQLAFWFSLVVTSFLFIWLITGAYDMITASILGLIGISVGTSLSGAVIDNSKSEEVLTQTLALKAEQKELQDRIPSLEAEIATNPANKTELNAELSIKKARLALIPDTIKKNTQFLIPKVSRGFVKDVLSDANGVSFHRLQMFVWTLVLGLLFLYSVWARLAMPEFSATMLALQGLTAGTYLGFKIPEKPQ